ncbi:MAG: hypothetical protein CMC18_04080 [Flavobacteriaceae bacterium]|nr:hypothetical protein [Flavobacteriaceae bacterium]
MANVRNLKKEINYVLGDIIEQIYQWEKQSSKTNSGEGSALIDECIALFDELIAKINQKSEQSPKEHYNAVRVALAKKSAAIEAKLAKL